MEEIYNYQILKDPEMKEIIESFHIETKEILEGLNNDLITFEKNPTDKELINQIFRSFHTIKGTSGFLGLEKLSEVTHKCEDILNKLRKEETKLNSAIIDALLTGYDIIKKLQEKIEVDLNEDVNTESCLILLDDLLTNIDQKPNEDFSISPQLEQPAEKIAEYKKSENTIRVDINRLDELLNITSEIVLNKNRLIQINYDLNATHEGTSISKDLDDAVKQIDIITNELQLSVMKTRLIKIGKIFNKFPRLVRDLSKESQKKISLILEGEDTELDKSIIEELSDPLLHLIRNSIDHGIELPEERDLCGKPHSGMIKLSASQEGNNIIIKIEDDGKGIDPQKIINKAVSKGLITGDKANDLSLQEVYSLLFLPGFSTAEKITNISGRGVGMDVVKTNVNKLRGSVTIDSIPGKKTVFTIKLPLTLAIIQGMIVRIGVEHYVIPLNSIIEVGKIDNNIKSINQKEVIQLREEVIPIIDLHNFMQKKESINNEYNYLVIVTSGQTKTGIKVNQLLGQKEVVIKTLGNYFGNIPGIAGSTIMGDGTVVMILDMAEIINGASK